LYGAKGMNSSAPFNRLQIKKEVLIKMHHTDSFFSLPPDFVAECQLYADHGPDWLYTANIEEIGFDDEDSLYP